MPSLELQQQLMGNRLVTAEIIYRLPDHPDLLQMFVWQNLDLVPRLPALRRFLRFWEMHLDGPLHLVRVATSSIIKPAEFRFVGGEFRLN